MDLHLANHTALITGAASGIGLATARAFAEEQCSLLLWDISPAVVDAAQQLRSDGIDAQAAVVDITDLAALQRTMADYLQGGRTIDHVVHSAAIGSGKFGFPFTEPGDWKRVLEVNIGGMVNVAHVVSPHFVERGQGTFVFIASIAGQIGSPTDPPYSASKAANINFAQCMAKDLAPHGIRVNTICPGMVQTPLNQSVWEAWHDQASAEERLSYEEWADRKIKSLVPLARWQSCEDMASMIVFLSSDRAQQVTGQTINVDGGQVMHW